MKKMTLIGYNLNSKPAINDFETEIEYNSYEELINIMKQTKINNNLEKIETKTKLAIYNKIDEDEDSNLINYYVELSIYREEELSYEVIGGEYFSQDELTRRADEEREEGDHETLLEAYIDNLRRGWEHSTSFNDFLDDLPDEEIYFYDDSYRNELEETDNMDEYWRLIENHYNSLGLKDDEEINIINEELFNFLKNNERAENDK